MRERENAAQGPVLPPMRAGLPFTTDVACKALLAGVIVQAVQDSDEESDEFFLSQNFDAYAALIGLSEPAAFVARCRYLLRLLDPAAFSLKSFDRQRWGDADKARRHVAETGDWDAWGATGYAHMVR